MKTITALVLAVAISLTILIQSLPTAESFHYQVGDQDGWSIPPNENLFYNQWASKHRFKVNDTLRFQYKDDSVMRVSEGDYEKCNSRFPIFFSNNENTLFTLNESGNFYFMSGVSGHCKRGQRMIVKVLEMHSDSTPPSHPPPTNGTSNVGNINSAYNVLSFVSFTMMFLAICLF